ncbi:MAG: Unknown protein [uncultured Thiotrichaceae bacterium]|uniref:Radical SAM core domain-containing protein n=1 Tax=uncultured Thiotrichaceae bacterium TaxID=298394 RepID=A0A6S6SUU6_9GAMM|nr:MAG: Unknown protein [uncultured Thiotrichaceae bacterium]
MKEKLERCFKIRLLLTGKCTAKCSYCHNEGQTKSANLLTLEYIKEIFGKLESKNNLPDEVILSGGEPTLNKQVKDIAKFLKSKSIYVSMASHIGHTDLLEPVLPYLDELKIHLDSFNHDEQLKSMGIPLENIINSINLAKKYPVKLIVNHPLINQTKTVEFIESARKMSLDCKIIEEFGNINNIGLDDVDWNKNGYFKYRCNGFKHVNSSHRLFLKRCDVSHDRERTLFIGAEGIRSKLEVKTSIKDIGKMDKLVTVI